MSRSGRETSAETRAPVRHRPRPAITHDNEFFWKGVEEGRLLIQQCRCGRLRHPPGPMCPVCHSLDWDTVEAGGSGWVYSYVVAHHPPVPPFGYPHVIVLVELAEGTRIVSNLRGVDADAVEIGMPVRAEFVELEAGRNFLQFRPASE